MILEKKNTLALPAYRFLEGGGEMGALTRAFDWTQTPLGIPDEWPQSLRTTLGILLNSKFPMFLFWGPELICFYNDAFRPSLGNDGKHPSALGKPGIEVWPEIWSLIKPLIDQVMGGGEAIWSEDQLIPIYRNGKIEDVYWTFSYSPVRDESGGIGGVFVTCVETTERIYKVKKIEQSEDAIRHLFAQAPVGISIYKGPGFIIDSINDKALKVLGKSREDILGNPLFEVMPEFAEQGFDQIFKNVYHNGSPFHTNGLRVDISRDGKMETLFFNVSIEPIYENDGKISGLITISSDVTVHVLASQKVEESVRNFRNLVLQAPIAICVMKGPSFIVEIANDRILEIWGKKEDEVINKPVLEALPEMRTQGIEDLLQKVYTTGERFIAYERTVTLSRQDGIEKLYLNFVYEPLKDIDGTISAIIAVAMDVTAQVDARQKIVYAEERARLAIEAAQLGMYDLNLTNGALITSSKLGAMLGFERPVTREEYINVFHPDDLPIREKAYEDALKGGYLFYEARVIWPDKSIHWVRAEGKVFYDADQKPIRILGTMQDITQQKLFSEELAKKVEERTKELAESNLQLKRTNEELEQFAYVASHDLQEPLRKMHIFTEMLENHLSTDDPKIKTYLQRISASSSRMITLIKDVLNFSQLSKTGQQFSLVDLNLVLKAVCNDFELLIEQKNAVIQAGGLPQLEAIPLQINQLFSNLISNSLKFTERGTQPVISITARSLTEDEVKKCRELNSNLSYYQIEFRDNGIGFRQEYAEQIFTIFQRLHDKQSYSGTGIGLALCKKIVLNHQGYMQAISKEGEGAVFRVMLPERQSR